MALGWLKVYIGNNDEFAYLATRFSQHNWRRPDVAYTHRDVMFCVKMLNEHEIQCSFIWGNS